MHANVVRMKYKDGKGLQSVVDGMQGMLPNLSGLAGFHNIHLVRTAENESVHVVVFDSPDHAREAREKMLPRFRDLAGPHAVGEPVVQDGPVMLQRSK